MDINKMLISYLLSFVEEISFFVFPLVLFRYKVKERVGTVLSLSLIVAITSNVIRPYIGPTYIILVLMLLVFVFLVIIGRFNVLDALVMLSTGYITQTSIMTLLFSALVKITNQDLNIVTSNLTYAASVSLTNSTILLVSSYFIYKKKWQINLEFKDTFLGKQTNAIIAAYSVVGLLMCYQTVTAFTLLYKDNILIYFATLILFFLFFIIIRNVKLMQKQLKLEEEKMYLEHMKTNVDEIKQINADFFSQMQTIQQISLLQNRESILFYLEHLLSERSFVKTSIEIQEPMLAAFLMKERHVCQSLGVSLKIHSIGHYQTPSCISGYQLNRILKFIFQDMISMLKESQNKVIDLVVDSTLERIKFTINSKTEFKLKKEIIEQIEMYQGVVTTGINREINIIFPR